MSKPTVGILLSNLGTPAEATVPAIRTFLAEFLADPRVVEFKPRWAWWLILHGIILRFRPKKILPVYKSVWTEAGSPLLATCQQITKKLQQALGDKYAVALGMRYGQPSIKTGLLELRKAGVKKVIILPLYPQYSATTSASTIDEVMSLLSICRALPELRFINDYYNHPEYIAAVVTSIQDYWQQHSRGKYLLFSYHGLPQRYVDQGDPYFQQCQKTTEAIVTKLKLAEDEWGMSFQSRVGREPWLQPYTDKHLTALAQQGMKQIDIVCPGFSVDCIETLDEIAVENRDIFVEAGGETVRYIPCLNEQDSHITMLQQLVIEQS